MGKVQLDCARVGLVSLAFAILVAVVIYDFGPVSGAHLNPAVAVPLALTRRFPRIEVVPYRFAQFVGACVGSLLVVADVYT